MCHETETRLITEQLLSDVAQIGGSVSRIRNTNFSRHQFCQPGRNWRFGHRRPARSACGGLVGRTGGGNLCAYPGFWRISGKGRLRIPAGPFTYGRGHATERTCWAERLEPYGGHRDLALLCLQLHAGLARPRRPTGRGRRTTILSAGRTNSGTTSLLQIKNGPMDFQVREPVSPLFGGMNKTRTSCSSCKSRRNIRDSSAICAIWCRSGKKCSISTRTPYGRVQTSGADVNGGPFNATSGGIAGVSQHRRRRELDRTSAGAGQSVRLRPAGLESGSFPRRQIAHEWIRLTFGQDEQVPENVARC